MKKYLLLLFCSISSYAQILDPTFNAAHSGPFNEYIGNTGLFTDNGKLLTISWGIGHHIRRYNSDGSLDVTFPTISEVNIDFLFKGTNGKFGGFNFGDESPELYFFNEDGSAITGFSQPVLSEYAYLWNAIWQADGKVIIVGDFTTVNGLAYKGIARLNTNGSVDTTFNIGTGFNAIVYCVAQQPDGKYVVGGNFSSFNGTTKRNLVRLNLDGSFDSTFYNYNTTNYYLYNGVRTVAIQSDGKIFVGGSGFVSGSTIVSKSVVRLLENGSRDTTFTCSLSTLNPMQEFLVLPDGKYLVYRADDGILYRLNNNGTQDMTFTYNNLALSFGMHSLQNISGNRIFIISNYKSSTGITRENMHVIYQNGLLDQTFNPQQSINSDFGTLKTLRNNKILVTGDFTAYNDVGCSPSICRLLENGEIDNSFTKDSQLYLGGRFFIKEQNDGKVLISKNTDYNGTTSIVVNSEFKHLIRINANGSLDNSFNLVIANLSSIYDFEILNSGKILVAMVYTDGTKRILRLNSDGTVDTGYTPLGLYDGLNRFTKFSDGSLFRVGRTSSSDPIVKKLLADGTVDTTFNCTLSNVYGVDRQTDGMFLVTYYASGQRKVVRVTNTGSVDATFVPITKANSYTGYDPLFINSENKIFVFRFATTPSQVDIYSVNGVFEQSVSGYYGHNLVKQGCDNVILSQDGFLSSEGNVDDLKRYKIFTGVITPAPTGASPQTFVQDYTLANLLVTGDDITWYSSQSQCGLNLLEKNAQEMQTVDDPLPISTSLVNGTTYYASQTIGGVESTYRLPILVGTALGVPQTDVESFGINNPVNDYLQLHSSMAFSKVELYSVSGIKVFEQFFQAAYNSEIRIGKFAKGLYIVKLYTETGVFTKKIIKE